MYVIKQSILFNFKNYNFKKNYYVVPLQNEHITISRPDIVFRNAVVNLTENGVNKKYKQFLKKKII